MACDDDTDDVPRHTIGLAEAEARLARLAWACEDTQGPMPITKPELLAADIRLVLRELKGLKQFDPR